MSQEEVVDAESSTLSKNTSPLDHLRHLIKIGWDPNTPLIIKFVEKYHLENDLEELIKSNDR